MVRVASFTVGVLAFSRAFLTAIARDYGAVEVRRQRAHAPTLICEENHSSEDRDTAVLRAGENLPTNRLEVL